MGGGDATKQKQLDKSLAAYASARKEGIQPRSTSLRDTTTAVAISDRSGVAFQADL